MTEQDDEKARRVAGAARQITDGAEALCSLAHAGGSGDAAPGAIADRFDKFAGQFSGLAGAIREKYPA